MRLRFYRLSLYHYIKIEGGDMMGNYPEHLHEAIAVDTGEDIYPDYTDIICCSGCVCTGCMFKMPQGGFNDCHRCELCINGDLKNKACDAIKSNLANSVEG